MYYVYLLRSINHPDQAYVGSTTNIEQRLDEHNSGKSTHTQKYKPWEIVSYTAFTDKSKAMSFEKYLKSGSGRAFSLRHLR